MDLMTAKSKRKDKKSKSGHIPRRSIKSNKLFLFFFNKYKSNKLLKF